VSRAVDRVLDVFETLSEEPEGLSLSELARRLEVPKGSLHPIVARLLARGYLARRGAAGGAGGAGVGELRLGLHLWSTGAAYLERLDLVPVAQPAMRRLADALNESVQLAMLDGVHNVYVARQDSRQPVRLVSRVGARLHAHATGLGKMLLAALPDAEVRRRLGPGPLPRFTAGTLAGVDALCAELARIRERGYATDDEEYTPGIRCVAMPVRDRSGETVAAMSVSVPAFRFDAALRERALAALGAATREVSSELGWRPQAGGAAGGAQQATAPRHARRRAAPVTPTPVTAGAPATARA
jgi:IclR family transcriptional regulator, KDG regulon repressor